MADSTSSSGSDFCCCGCCGWSLLVPGGNGTGCATAICTNATNSKTAAIGHHRTASGEIRLVEKAPLPQVAEKCALVSGHDLGRAENLKKESGFSPFWNFEG